jgi:hypothetical protein
MSDTYKFLHKQMKQAFDDFDIKAVDYYLEREMYSELAYMVHLVNKTHEEGKPMSQYHQEALEYINNKWGDNTSRVLKSMTELMWEDIKAGKFKKPEKLSREARMKIRLDSCAAFM